MRSAFAGLFEARQFGAQARDFGLHRLELVAADKVHVGGHAVDAGSESGLGLVASDS